GIVFLFRKKLSHYRLQINYVFGAYFLISNLLLVIWYVTTDNWSWKHSLPIELCTIFSLLVGLICLLCKTNFILYLCIFYCFCLSDDINDYTIFFVCYT